MTTAKRFFHVLIYVFASIGLIFVGVYFAMQWGLLNVKGSISSRNSYFSNLEKSTLSKTDASSDLVLTCQINVLGTYAPLTAVPIYKTLSQGASYEVLTEMISVASRRFITDPKYTNAMRRCSSAGVEAVMIPQSAYEWADTDEWALMKDVFTRDQDVIKKAAADAHISPRILLGGVIGEQFRFFGNRRESFKSYFEPLKILASLSNTSFGIAGLKPKTVGQIEGYLKDTTSPFYLGSEMEHVADYTTGAGTDAERLTRITDTKNPYYPYLYVGLYMKEIEAQWKKAGYPIDNRPDVLATLYNLGFYYSKPNANPVAGGSTILINGKEYIFGDIAYEFYYSGELSNIFPLEVQ